MKLASTNRAEAPHQAFFNDDADARRLQFTRLLAYGLLYDHVLTGAIGSHQANDRTEVTARYDAEYRQDFLNQTASVKVRWAF